MCVKSIMRGEATLFQTVNRCGEWRRAVDVTGTGSYFLLIIPLCARGTFLVHGVTVTMGGEFGCLIVLITPLGRVGR